MEKMEMEEQKTGTETEKRKENGSGIEQCFGSGFI
jgi:hypothetical protein